MKTKKDKHYIPILDQPIEELKKPIGEKVDFNAIMKKALSYNVKKERWQEIATILIICLHSHFYKPTQ